METLLVVLVLAAGLPLLFALDRWKWSFINRERQRRLDEGNPAPIDRLPKAARGPVLLVVVAIAAALKLLLD